MEKRNWELKYFCENDKYAVKSYCTIFDESESKNLGDITKVDENEVPWVKMMSSGSPCQSFSIAGSQEGAYWLCSDCGHKWNPLMVQPIKRRFCPVCGSENHDHTKSAVLVDWLRILAKQKPDWFIYENVKNILGKKFKSTFDSNTSLKRFSNGNPFGNSNFPLSRLLLIPIMNNRSLFCGTP